jgi:hypothetical protein
MSDAALRGVSTPQQSGESRVKFEHPLADAQPVCGALCQVGPDLRPRHGVDLRARKKTMHLLYDFLVGAKPVTDLALLDEEFGDLQFWSFLMRIGGRRATYRGRRGLC